MRAAFAVLLLLAAGGAFADEVDRRGPVLAAARDVVAPAYDRLAEVTRLQAETWRSQCAAPATLAIDTLRARYAAAADAWSGIEFVKYGPVLDENRFERMAHWPERGNAVTRALAALLARPGTEGLAPDAVAGGSAAGQGLSALERLLFDPAASDTVATRLTKGPDAARRCAVGAAIAANLARMADAVSAGWRRPAGTLETLERADADALKEAATRLATEILAFLEYVGDAKIGAPLGKGGPDEARPTLAEGWRAGRSLRAIALDLDGVSALVTALVDPTSDEGSSVLAALETACRLAHDTPGSLDALVQEPDRRPDLVLLRNAISGARELAGAALTASLDVTIGFNSRDGD